MKKAFLSLLCIVLVFSMLPLAASAAVTKNVAINAKVGKETNQTIYFEENGITSEFSGIVSSDLNNVGLRYTVAADHIRIVDIPTKAGTASTTVSFKDGSKLTVNVTVTAPVKKTINLEYSLGDKVDYYIRQADHGISGTLSLKANLTALGLHTGSIPSSYAQIYGTAESTGKGSAVLTYTDGSEITVNISVTDSKTPAAPTETKSPVKTTIDLEYAVGDEVDYYIRQADYGISGALSLKANLTALGLHTGSIPSSYAQIYGTAKSAGKGSAVLTYTDGSEITVNITVKESAVPVEKTVAVDAVVGKETDRTFTPESLEINSDIYTVVYSDFSYWLDLGLNCAYTTSYIQIYGTPTKAGTTSATLIFRDNSKVIFNITVAEPENETEPTAPEGDTEPTVPEGETEPTVPEGETEPATPEGDTEPTEPEAAYVFPFVDVLEKDWFYKDVYNANKMGLIDGKDAAHYKPNDNMTYAEAIKLAACMNQYYTEGKVTLSNGSPNWYDSYVDYARTHGIPWDYNNYNEKVSRRDYVHIFYYALPKDNYKAINSVTVIPDVKSGDRYASEIFTFYNAGILTGNDTKGTFSPSSNIKRSEVAAILSRMMDDTARKTFTLK